MCLSSYFFSLPFLCACRPARKNLSIGDRNSVTDKIKNFSNLPASPPAHMTLYDTVTQEVFTYTIKNNCQLLPSWEFIRVRTFLFYVGYVFWGVQGRELGAVASNPPSCAGRLLVCFLPSPGLVLILPLVCL